MALRAGQLTLMYCLFCVSERVNAGDCSPRRSIRLNQRVWRTNRVINLTRYSGLPQFHCLYSTCGCLCHGPGHYGLNIPGIINEAVYSFVGRAVGDVNQSMKMKIRKLTVLSVTYAVCMCGLLAGGQKKTTLSNWMKVMSASVLSNGVSNISGRSN
jgi:hypothetical protein